VSVVAEFVSLWRAYGSGGQMRAELYLSDPPAITKDTATVTQTALARIRTTASITDTFNSNVLNGSIAASDPNKSVVHGSGGGVTEVCLGIGAIATVYGAPVVVTVTATLSGYEIVSGATAVAGSVTIPARPYQLPAAPTGVAAARNSDTSHTVTWTRHVSTAAPYSAQRVQRSTDGGAWATVATVSATATSYTDLTTGADHSYRWRVVADNSSGSTASAASSTLYTTPKAPGTPVAVKDGSNIVLTFTNTARHDVGVKVYESVDGGAFALVDTVATADLTTWTHIAPSAEVTHAYKVATYNGALVSALSAASNTVQLLAAPAAPTGLGPSVVRDATEDVVLVWTHNPVDSSPQSAFQVRHRELGAGEWTTETPVTSTTSSWTLAAGTYTNPDTVEWQVATKGAHADYSPWSATATLPSSTRPTATITTPADATQVETSTLFVAWAYHDAEGSAQSAWEVRLYDGVGALVETTSGVGAPTSTTMATVVGDATSWSVWVRVADGAGLWSAWDTAAFTVAYALPTPAVLVLTWDPVTATVALEITNPVVAEFAFPFGSGDFGDGGFGGSAFGGVVAPPVVQNRVWRSAGGGSWELIATGVPPDTTIIDWSAPTTGDVDYRVEAFSGLPSVAVTQETVTTGGTTAVFVSASTEPGGGDFSVVCVAGHRQTVTQSRGRLRVLKTYAGRTYPLERAGQAKEHTLTLSAELVPGVDSSPEQWLDLADLAGPHLWRDPDGRRVLVSVATPRIVRPVGGVSHALTLVATRLDGVPT
jgi:hypothetical protein